MAKIRDTATVILENGIPQFKRDSKPRRRPAKVERKHVDIRVWQFAMRRVGNDAKRIVPISNTEVQILPEEP